MYPLAFGVGGGGLVLLCALAAAAYAFHVARGGAAQRAAAAAGHVRVRVQGGASGAVSTHTHNPLLHAVHRRLSPRAAAAPKPKLVLRGAAAPFAAAAPPPAAPAYLTE